jgi:hypothetical protein
MEPIGLSQSAAAAAITAYRSARRSKVARRVADDVALARYRAYFPLASEGECRGKMREHLARERQMRQRAVERSNMSVMLAVSN